MLLGSSNLVLELHCLCSTAFTPRLKQLSKNSFYCVNTQCELSSRICLRGSQERFARERFALRASSGSLTKYLPHEYLIVDQYSPELFVRKKKKGSRALARHHIDADGVRNSHVIHFVGIPLHTHHSLFLSTLYPAFPSGRHWLRSLLALFSAYHSVYVRIMFVDHRPSQHCVETSKLC